MKLRHLSSVANNQARKVIDNHIALVFLCFLHFYRPFNFFKLFGAHLVEALRVHLVKFLSEIFSASFLFSVILVLSCLPFLPMYTLRSPPSVTMLSLLSNKVRMTASLCWSTGLCVWLSCKQVVWWIRLPSWWYGCPETRSVHFSMVRAWVWCCFLLSIPLRWPVSASTFPLSMISRMSSTYLFHSLGLQSMGAMAMACCSSHSIKKSARIEDIGVPLPVPNFCLNNSPLKLKYVVVAINSVRSIISSTSRFDLLFRSWSFSRPSLMMVNVSCIGILVNSDTTSWKLKMSSCSNVTENNSSASSLEFLTWCSHKEKIT